MSPLLLTYSTEQSPPWETNWFAASQEISRLSRNPKVHYRNHKHEYDNKKIVRPIILGGSLCKPHPIVGPF